MRLFSLMLGAWLCLSAYPCRAEGRIHGQVALIEDAPEPLEIAPMHFSFTLDSAPELSLLPPLELPEIDEPQAPLAMRESIVPPYLVMVGRSRGAMLDRCRGRMRNVTLIGHGASTDGRPDTCRLLSFVGLQKYRERAMRRRAGVRNRFMARPLEEMPDMPHFAANFAPLPMMPNVIGVGRAKGPGRLPPPPPPPGRLVW